MESPSALEIAVEAWGAIGAEWSCESNRHTVGNAMARIDRMSRTNRKEFTWQGGEGKCVRQARIGALIGAIEQPQKRAKGRRWGFQRGAAPLTT